MSGSVPGSRLHRAEVDSLPDRLVPSTLRGCKAKDLRGDHRTDSMARPGSHADNVDHVKSPVSVGALRHLRRRTRQISPLTARERPRRTSGSVRALREQARRVDAVELAARRGRYGSRGRLPWVGARSGARGDAEVVEYLPRDGGVLDCRDQLHASRAARTAERVDPMRSLEQHGPRERRLAACIVGAGDMEAQRRSGAEDRRGCCWCWCDRRGFGAVRAPNVSTSAAIPEARGTTIPEA